MEILKVMLLITLFGTYVNMIASVPQAAFTLPYINVSHFSRNFTICSSWSDFTTSPDTSYWWGFLTEFSLGVHITWILLFNFKRLRISFNITWIIIRAPLYGCPLVISLSVRTFVCMIVRYHLYGLILSHLGPIWLILYLQSAFG